MTNCTFLTLTSCFIGSCYIPGQRIIKWKIPHFLWRAIWQNTVHVLSHWAHDNLQSSRCLSIFAAAGFGRHWTTCDVGNGCSNMGKHGPHAGPTRIRTFKPGDLPRLWKTSILYLNLPCIFAPKSCKNAGNSVSETLFFKMLRCLVPSALCSPLWWSMVSQGDHEHCFHSNLALWVKLRKLCQRKYYCLAFTMP